MMSVWTNTLPRASATNFLQANPVDVPSKLERLKSGALNIKSLMKNPNLRVEPHCKEVKSHLIPVPFHVLPCGPCWPHTFYLLHVPLSSQLQKQNQKALLAIFHVKNQTRARGEDRPNILWPKKILLLWADRMSQLDKVLHFGKYSITEKTITYSNYV